MNERDPQKLRVGISIFVRKGEQSLWENGIFQNCLFLVLLLLKAPNVSATFLVFGAAMAMPPMPAGSWSIRPFP